MDADEKIDSYKKRHYRSLKQRGICVTCQCRPAVSGYVSCKECREKLVFKTRTRNDKLKSEGICLQCAKNPARKGKTICFECAIKASERYYERKTRNGKGNKNL